MRSVHVIVSGRVQGVGYRLWLEQRAREAGLGGWARNRREGTVEALLSGDDDAVAGLIEALWRGPPAARVDAVQVADHPAPDAPGFRVLPTA